MDRHGELELGLPRAAQDAVAGHARGNEAGPPGRATGVGKSLTAGEGQGTPMRLLLAPHAWPMCTSSVYGWVEEEDN